MRRLWCSTPAWTAQVNVTEEGRIMWAAPILRRFESVHFSRLENWCRNKGWLLTVEELKPE